jgi:hypothetical protein
MVMTDKPDPTKDPEFQRVLKNMLTTPPKPHSEMKLGRRKTQTRKRKPRRTK